jgi:Glycosyl transferase family 2
VRPAAECRGARSSGTARRDVKDVRTIVVSYTQTKAIGVVIVNYASHDHLRYCLASLPSQLDIRVTIVDNYSSDSERRKAMEIAQKADFSACDFIPLDKNVGFGAGCNVGAARAISFGCEQLLFLNPDAQLAANALEHLLAASRSDPGAILSPVIDERNSGETWFEGAALDARCLVARHDHSKTGDPDWLTGCALLVPSEYGARLAASMKTISSIGKISILHGDGAVKEGDWSLYEMQRQSMVLADRLKVAANHHCTFATTSGIEPYSPPNIIQLGNVLLS